MQKRSSRLRGRTGRRTISAILLLFVPILVLPLPTAAQSAECLEPNDQAATACSIGNRANLTGTIGSQEDIDAYRFLIQVAGTRVRLELTDLPADYDLSLNSASGEVLGQSTQEGTSPEIIETTLPSVGTYFIYVYVDATRPFDPSHQYRLQLIYTDTPGPAPGTVVYSDSFDDPVVGWLPKSSSDPARYVLGYIGGEYLVQKVDPAWDRIPTASLPGMYANASIGIDVRLVGDAVDRYVAIGCRDYSPVSQYRLSVRPDRGRFALLRLDSGQFVQLVNWQTSAAIRQGNETNRLELSCVGNTIAASINGSQVASVQDATYQEGRIWIGASKFLGLQLASEARFDNLVVVQR